MKTLAFYVGVSALAAFSANANENRHAWLNGDSLDCVRNQNDTRYFMCGNRPMIQRNINEDCAKKYDNASDIDKFEYDFYLNRIRWKRDSLSPVEVRNRIKKIMNCD